VVDFGSGDAPYKPLFEQRGIEYVTADLDGDTDVRIVPGEPLPIEDASVDGVVSFQVLEHVWDLQWYLSEAKRILKPGGFLLLSTHGTWLYHPHPTDFRRWTSAGLRGEIEAEGFAVQQFDPLVGPLAWTTQFRLLGLREALRRVPVLGGLLLPVVAAVMNLRMVVEDAITPKAISDDNACVYLTYSTRPS
jgi:SAM-dependent methyltransferase